MKKSLYKIKEGRTELWKSWCNLLMTIHYDEAVQTIKEEQLVREACWFFKVDKDKYIYYEHEPREGHVKLPWSRKHLINWVHFYLLNECLVYIESGDHVENKFLNVKKEGEKLYEIIAGSEENSPDIPLG